MGDTSEPEDIGLVPHNRGNKLKIGATYVGNGRRLRAAIGFEDDFNAAKFGKKRATIMNKSNAGYYSSDEDPYGDINIEEILGPLEKAEDLLERRPLRKILQSKHLESLAATAMEMIENEKSLNKVLSRFAAIIQGDDPQYQDISYEDLLNGSDAQMSELNADDDQAMNDIDNDIYGDPRELMARVRELVMENINCSNEYLMRLSDTRKLLTRAHSQRTAVIQKLREKQQQRPRPSSHQGTSNGLRSNELDLYPFDGASNGNYVSAGGSLGTHPNYSRAGSAYK
ncbi:uncharacterized protein VTP21DRAFT_991 [Calcarisporiella thermophila]|uniref:uncharacterized protein n=1 Tax=Calcarisporiella thermophila TaxID=911321 RepID=UPI0037432017